jgi:hypothetical protein
MKQKDDTIGKREFTMNYDNQVSLARLAACD